MGGEREFSFLQRFWRISLAVILISLGAAGGAEIVVDGQAPSGHRPGLDRARNGTTVVNIATPNRHGVSHNTYIKFNVPKRGAVLNNSARATRTKTAGYIYGNRNVKDRRASLILNEVSGREKTRFDGFLEVAGKKADVIVANPNGIRVNGGGFINTARGFLTTGKVGFDGGKPIFNVRRGRIEFEGKGFNGRGADSLHIYTRAMKLNAKIHARGFRAVLGTNRIGPDGKITKIGGEGNAPTISLDSSNLGGIYADTIELIGTEKGLGVNLPPEVMAQDRAHIEADGKIRLDKLRAGGKATITSHSGSIHVRKGIHARKASLRAKKGSVTLEGNSGARESFELESLSLLNRGLLAAGVDENFRSLGTVGSLTLTVADAIRNLGSLYGGDQVTIRAGSFYNDLHAALVGETLSMELDDVLENQGRITASEFTLAAEKLVNGSEENREATIDTSKRLSADLGSLENRGWLESQKEMGLSVRDSLTNRHWIRAGEALSISGTQLVLENFGGIFAMGSLLFDGKNLSNFENSTIASLGAMNLYLSGTLRNKTGATIYGDNGLNIAKNEQMERALRIENIGGFIGSGEGADVHLSAEDVINESEREPEKGSTTETLGTLNMDQTATGVLLDENGERIGKYRRYYRVDEKEVTETARELMDQLIQNGETKEVIAEVEEVRDYTDFEYGMMTYTRYCVAKKCYDASDRHIRVIEEIPGEPIRWENGTLIPATPPKVRIAIASDEKNFEKKLLNRLNQKYERFGVRVGEVAQFGWDYSYTREKSKPKRAFVFTGIEPIHKHETKRTYSISTTTEHLVKDEGRHGVISSGGGLTVDAGTLENRYSDMLVAGDIDLEKVEKLRNISLELHRTTKTSGTYHYKKGHGGMFGGLHDAISGKKKKTAQLGERENSMIIGNLDSRILSGGKIHGTVTEGVNGVGEGVNDLAIPSFDGEVAVPDPAKITLPTGDYGLYITNPDPNGPLIETNPEFTDKKRFIGSDYFLKRLGYDPDQTLRRLADARYETELIRQAVAAMTGQRFIDGATSDSEQYRILMDNGIEVAELLGLTLGKSLDEKQKSELKKLGKDIVWMEEKVVAGRKVLVPVLYLADGKRYEGTRGAVIAGHEVDLNFGKGFVNNGGTLKAEGRMDLHADTLENRRGNLLAGGTLDAQTRGDLLNLSGRIKGGSVRLESEEGSLVHKTASKTVESDRKGRKNTSTTVGQQAGIESTSGSVELRSEKNLQISGAHVSSAANIELESKNGDIDIRALEERNGYQIGSGKNFEKAEQTTYRQSGLRANGNLHTHSAGDTVFEATKVKASDFSAEAGGKIKSLAVVENDRYEKKSRKKRFLSKKSSHEIHQAQEVIGSSFDVGSFEMKGKKGNEIESARIVAHSGRVDIDSEEGDTLFRDKTATNIDFRETRRTSLGGLKKSHKLDSRTEELISENSTHAQTTITVGGRNIRIDPGAFTTEKGGIHVTAAEGGDVLLTARKDKVSETHLREKSSVLSGGHLYEASSDGTVKYDERVHTSRFAAGNGVSNAGVEITGDRVDNYGADLSSSGTGKVSLDARNGNVHNHAVYEEHRTEEHHEKITLGLDRALVTPQAFKLKEGKLKIALLKGEYNKDEKSVMTRIAKTSHIDGAQGGYEVIAKKGKVINEGTAYHMEGARSTIYGDRGIEDRAVSDTVTVRHKKTHADVEVSATLGHVAVDAAVAANRAKAKYKKLKEAKKAFEEQKKHVAQLKKDLLEGKASYQDVEEAEQYLKYYKLNIAIAAKELYDAGQSAYKTAATAANSAELAGFVGGLEASAHGSKRSQYHQETTTHGVTYSGSGEVVVETGKNNGSSVTWTGSKDLMEKGSHYVFRTNELNLKAAKNTATDRSDERGVSASVRINTSGNSDISYSAGASGTQKRSKEITHDLTQIHNDVTLDIAGDVHIKGAVVDGKTGGYIAGDTHVESVQDSLHSTSFGLNVNHQVSGSGGGGSSSTSAGVNGEKEDYLAVTHKTIFGNDDSDLKIEGTLFNKGSNVGSDIKAKKRVEEEIRNRASYLSASLQASTGDLSDLDSYQGDVGDIIHEQKSSVTRPNERDGLLHRVDSDSAHMAHQAFDKAAKELYSKVGDYAMEEAAKGDKDWEDGGIKKIALHAGAGALLGDLVGIDPTRAALGAAAGEAVSPYTKDKSDFIKKLVSTTSGAVVGGIDGAKTAQKAFQYNRQLHTGEIEWLEKHAIDFARQLYGPHPTPEQINDAKSRLAQQALRQVDKLWSYALGDRVDEAAKRFLLYESRGKLFTVKDEFEFRNGMTDGERSLADMKRWDYKKLNRFYGQYVHTSNSFNEEGSLRNIREGFRDESNRALDSIDGETINQAIRDFVPNTVRFLLELPEHAEGATRYLSSLIPTKATKRLDTLYGQGVEASLTQADLDTGDAIAMGTMVLGGRTPLVRVGKKTWGAAKNVAGPLLEGVEELMNAADVPKGDLSTMTAASQPADAGAGSFSLKKLKPLVKGTQEFQNALDNHGEVSSGKSAAGAGPSGTSSAVKIDPRKPFGDPLEGTKALIEMTPRQIEMTRFGRIKIGEVPNKMTTTTAQSTPVYADLADFNLLKDSPEARKLQSEAEWALITKKSYGEVPSSAKEPYIDDPSRRRGRGSYEEFQKWNDTSTIDKLKKFLFGKEGRDKNLDHGSEKSKKPVEASKTTSGWSELSGDVRRYLRDIEKQTGRKIPKKQLSLLKEDLKRTVYKRLSPEERKRNRREFNRRKKRLIEEWEEETGQKWPVQKDGKGHLRNYDAHHIVENKVGGKSEWWNIHPAKNPTEHQQGIHRKGSPAEKLFGNK